MATSWDFGDTKEDLIHRIHPYPARFPAFITSKALEYAEADGVNVRNVADVFCGCGTTAVESKRNGKDYWGCDINPLATLIAQVKTHKYRDRALERTYAAIRDEARRFVVRSEDRAEKSDRIHYWFSEANIDELIRLDRAIRSVTRPYSAHRRFFQCGFSAILKGTSYWLTKSIKAQRDPNKDPRPVREAFEEQIDLMRRANAGNEFPRPSPKTRIRARNFLGSTGRRERADLIVTSPPYATSYNYADIHQLSTLWLGYASDYRALRRNMLGNRHGIHPPQEKTIKRLGETAWYTYKEMQTQSPSHASSIAKYHLDLDKTVRRCRDLLVARGMAVFVIGNTQYKSVKVDNAQHLEFCMERAGFNTVRAIPRRVSLKTMTPYRDALGRFTRDSSQRRVYAEEFILIGTKA
ncbi:MAG: hypothetical protein OXI01_23160 [Albidovulum sp.]|nr:hypothetical protein [Albidovulum sp.]